MAQPGGRADGRDGRNAAREEDGEGRRADRDGGDEDGRGVCLDGAALGRVWEGQGPQRDRARAGAPAGQRDGHEFGALILPPAEQTLSWHGVKREDEETLWALGCRTDDTIMLEFLSPTEPPILKILRAPDKPGKAKGDKKGKKGGKKKKQLDDRDMCCIGFRLAREWNEAIYSTKIRIPPQHTRYFTLRRFLSVTFALLIP